jgi:ribosome-binding factor A
MSSASRITRINTLIQHEVAQQLYRVVNDPGYDPAAVTVTHVFTSSDLRHSRVLVSIRGDEARQRQLLGIIARHRGELRSLVGRHVVLKYTPQISFELDPSIAQGDHVLGLISRMEDEHPEWKGGGPAPEGGEPAT